MTAAGAVLLAGASGLVGGGVLSLALATDGGPRVVAPVRRPLASAHPRLSAPVADLSAGTEALSSVVAAAAPQVSAYVCCLGTTLRQAGSREAFLAVDRDLVLRLGEVARRLGARHAILVSSVGASSQSGNFYLRVKGEAERGLAELGFERLDLLRPGLLLGARAERRRAEGLGQHLAPLANPLLLGGLRRYRAIAASDVAAAAFALLQRGDEPGRFVHEFDSLRALSRGGA